METKTERIATNKTTGKRYFVQQINFQEGKVYCWGEVSKYKNLSTTHEKSKTFLKDTVEITEVEKTASLIDSLFEQHLKGKEEQGFIIKRNKVVSKVVGKRNEDGAITYF